MINKTSRKETRTIRQKRVRTKVQGDQDFVFSKV